MIVKGTLRFPPDPAKPSKHGNLSALFNIGPDDPVNKNTEDHPTYGRQLRLWFNADDPAVSFLMGKKNQEVDLNWDPNTATYTVALQGASVTAPSTPAQPASRPSGQVRSGVALSTQEFTELLIGMASPIAATTDHLIQHYSLGQDAAQRIAVTTFIEANRSGYSLVLENAALADQVFEQAAELVAAISVSPKNFAADVLEAIIEYDPTGYYKLYNVDDQKAIMAHLIDVLKQAGYSGTDLNLADRSTFSGLATIAWGIARDIQSGKSIEEAVNNNSKGSDGDDDQDAGPIPF